MKTKDIKPGTVYRVMLGRLSMRGGGVDVLQSGYVLARVELVGEEADREAVSVNARSWRDGKRTVKVTITRGIPDHREDGYGNASVGAVRYVRPQQVLIEAEQGDRDEAARKEGFARQKREMAERRAAMQPTADRLNRIQLERGLTTTDYSGKIVPIVGFSVTDYGSLSVSSRLGTSDAVRLVEALEGLPIPNSEEVTA